MGLSLVGFKPNESLRLPMLAFELFSWLLCQWEHKTKCRANYVDTVKKFLWLSFQNKGEKVNLSARLPGPKKCVALVRLDQPFTAIKHLGSHAMHPFYF